MGEIKKYLPSDAEEIAKKIDNKTTLIGYQSESLSQVFQNEKGMILIRVGEGIKGSTVRGEGATVVRMTAGIDSYSLKDLGLTK